MFPRASLRQGLIKIIPNAAAGILARKKVEKKPQIKLDFLFYLIFLRRERIMNLTLVTSYKSSSCLYQIRFQ